ncbi:MAG TPA: mechanosensitive ion channel family protein [Acidimicrobiales bacterium]|nr:mechanosensitive ion channel family protein [Acidimicrobiales bacterium]
MFTAPVIAMLAQAGGRPADEIAACGPAEEASSVCLAVYRATHNELLAGVADTVIVKPAKILLILLLAFLATRLIGRVIRRFVQGMTGEKVQHRLGSFRKHAPVALLKSDQIETARAVQRAQTIGALLRSIASFAVWVVAALMVMGELGLNLGPLIAGAGIVGVAFGFGAQNLVRDFITGIFMLVEDQYGVGDIIDAGPASGTVEAVSLRTTRLRDVDGIVWHIPNGTIQRIGNKSQKWSRALLDVDVAYDTDVDFAGEVVKRTLDDIANSEEWSDVILEEPEVQGAEDLGPDGITIRLVVKTLPSAQFKVARHVRARIKAAFDEEGIEIPFPQRDVWDRSGDGGKAASPDGGEKAEKKAGG